MPTANLNVEIPPGAWIHDVSTDHPDATFRVLSVHSSDATGVVLLEIDSRDVDPILSAIEAHDEVLAFEPIGTEDRTTLVQVETANPRLLSAVLSAGVPLQTPFEVHAGLASWEITTSSDRLSSLGDRLDAAGIEYDLQSVQHHAVDPTKQLLTDRQREVLMTAYEMGYYETPRRATLTEVAGSLDVSKATVSDILHRAEGRVVDWIVEEFLMDGPA